MFAVLGTWPKWCGAAAAALAILPAFAIARGPRFEQYVRYEMSVDHPSQGFVFDLNATRKDPYDTAPPFISKASMQLSPKLCEGAYKLAFVFTPVRGGIVKFPYPVRVNQARLDGSSRRCPFAGLPRRGLRSMRVGIFVDGKILLRFSARPSSSAGETFKRLEVPAMRMYQFTAPGGHVRIQVSAGYSRGGSHQIELLADTKPPR
jgi:hypothetical protein